MANKKEKHCLECKKIRGRNTKRFCSKQCETDYNYKKNVSQWLKGKLSGHKNSRNHDIKSFVRRYILEKQGYKCLGCGYNRINEFSGKSVLQIDHIDGNSENTKENNLRAICPNCHSLTSNYMGLNRGKSKRQTRYTGRLAER